ncbi:MAG: VCBS repeat-containing protein [Flavobacteriales bacterium]|nr:VCBS repeat-containing protein [Flavobacteriales bacterium]
MNKISTLAACSSLLFAVGAIAQPSFTNTPGLLPYATHSGNCMAVSDLNGDGLDDIAVLDSSTFLRILYQNLDGSFHGYNVGSVGTAQQWGMAVADMDNDGHKDVFTGGNGDGQHYWRITAPGSSTAGTVQSVSMFMQNISIGDIDNDGHLDVFGCHDNAAPRTWMNDGNGTLNLGTPIDFTSDPVSDMSGNYGSVFTDFNNDGNLDLYIAKCRQGVNNPADPRRWNRMFVNDGNGNYTDLALEHGIQIRYQSWCADFGDWDNDGDLDLVVGNHDHKLQFFENDGNGYFTEVPGTDTDIVGMFIQSHFEDFDNDGNLDILLSGSSTTYLKGNGDGTFTPISGLFPYTSNLHSYAIGDLNNDGFMDVWSSYGTGYTTPHYGRPDRLWLNDGNDNHWLNVRLAGVESNRDAVGARVTLTTALGTQIREVRAGESYGLTNTAMCHFGLADHTTVETLVVRWPSGQVDTYTNIDADQEITLVEGTCIAPVVNITSNDGLHMCPGGTSITLTATGGSSYAWNTGEVTASIIVSEPGYHKVTVDAETPCSAAASVFIIETPDITPEITSDVPLESCWNTPITLTSSDASSYLWNTGETTQSITTTVEGDYTVTVSGICPDITSAPVTIAHLPTPAAPTSQNVTIQSGTSATLVAQGDSILWYDTADATSPVGLESPWTTPVLTEATSYWCAEASQPVDNTVYGGMASPGTNANAENNSVYFPIFECYSPFQLKSVLVKAATEGVRIVGLVEWPSGTPVVSGNFNLPAGESRIDLNWDITPGTYGLRMFGDNIGMTYNNVSNGYPYPLGDVGAIVSTTNGGSGATAYFEIFYDWEVGFTTYTCEGPRTQVDVAISTVGIAEATNNDGVKVYPVPAHNTLSVDMGALQGPVELEVMDISGRVIQRERAAAGTYQLDISGLASGDYQLRVVNNSSSEVHRFVVQ